MQANGHTISLKVPHVNATTRVSRRPIRHPLPNSVDDRLYTDLSFGVHLNSWPDSPICDWICELPPSQNRSLT